MLDALSEIMVVWLRSTPMRPCSNATNWDALPWSQLLRAYLSPFPLYAHACLCHSLAFCASLHARLHVHAWVLLASVSSMLQHNEVMDIRSKPTFVPYGHHILLAFSLVGLFACLLAFWFLCLPCLSCLSTLGLFICSLHLFLSLLVSWFLAFAFAFACTHMERGHLELGHSLPSASKRGADVSMSI